MKENKSIRWNSRQEMQKLSRSVLQQERSSASVFKVVLIFLVTIIVFFIFWSTKVPLSEVVTAKGQVQPLEDVFLIQHATGGKIYEIFVAERDTVTEGDPLFSLDRSMLELQVLEGNSGLYSLGVQRDLLLEELEIQEKLHEQRLISTVVYLSLQREIAAINGRITAARQMLDRYKLLSENSVLYAPINGIVHGLVGHGPGTIIKPGETIFSIVPQNAKFYAQINIPAYRIGSIKPGLPIVLKFSAYNFSRYGGMETTLKDFSATTFLDSSGEPYYKGIVTLNQNFLGDNPAELPILQGMTLVAEVQTGTKTLFDYLFLPVKASTNSALKEP